MRILTFAILLCAGVALSQLSPSNPFFTAAVLKTAGGGGGPTFPSGAVAYWKMDESGVSDRTDTVASIVLANSVNSALRPNSATGIINNAGDFVPASFNYLDTADSSTLSMGANVDFTISVWFKTDASPNYQVVLDKNNASTYDYRFRIYGGGDNKLHFVINTGSDDVSSTSSISTGTWYHAVVTYDGSNIRLYLNGSLETTYAFSADVTDGAGLLEIGGSTNIGGGFWDGLIDELGIWKRALSGTEVGDLYNGGAGLQP
jgi:hypothetical protein